MAVEPQSQAPSDRSFSDVHHGSRGGGPLHVIATVNNHGFMSSDDKAVLDDLSSTGDELSALESAISDEAKEAAELSRLILTEFRVISFLLAEILSTSNPGTARVDLDQLRNEMATPMTELQSISWLLDALLSAVNPGRTTVDLDQVRQVVGVL